MAEISRDDVAHLARLARIEIPTAELDHYAAQLDAILERIGTPTDWERRQQEREKNPAAPVARPIVLTHDKCLPMVQTTPRA